MSLGCRPRRHPGTVITNRQVSAAVICTALDLYTGLGDHRHCVLECVGECLVDNKTAVEELAIGNLEIFEIGCDFDLLPRLLEARGDRIHESCHKVPKAEIGMRAKQLLLQEHEHPDPALHIGNDQALPGTVEESLLYAEQAQS